MKNHTLYVMKVEYEKVFQKTQTSEQVTGHKVTNSVSLSLLLQFINMKLQVFAADLPTSAQLYWNWGDTYKLWQPDRDICFADYTHYDLLKGQCVRFVSI